MKKVVFFITLTSIACLAFQPQEKLATIETNGAVKELPVQNNDAFKRGEKLSFRLHYGIIEAGTANLMITDEAKEFAGRKTFHVVGLGNSRGMFDFFYKVRDRYETYVDEKALVPWFFTRRVNEGGYIINQDYVFNHYNQKVTVGASETYPIEPNMQDMLSAFYMARNLDLSNAKPNDVYSINCFMDKEIWPLKIKFICKENVKTDLGTFKCLKFRPLIQKGRVFKHEEDLNVWISDDKNHIPVKGQADVLIGSVKVELKSFSGLANPVAKVN